MTEVKLKNLANRIAKEGMTPELREEFVSFVQSLTPENRIALRDVLKEMFEAASRSTK